MRRISTLQLCLTLFIFTFFMSCSSDDVTTNEDNENEVEIEIDITSDAKQMISFEFSAEENAALSEGIIATIDEEEKTITAIFPFDTDISSLTPSMEISPDATVTPTGAQDFSESVTYTVTAEDESTAEYTTVIAVEGSDAKEITSFVFAAADNTELSEDITATIDEDSKTITATLPYGISSTTLTPTIEVSMLATVSPTGVQDFSESITYTVTADDQSTTEYTTAITIVAQSPFVTTWKTTTDNESITIYINNEVAGYDYAIDWGDGTTETGLTGNATHEYATAGTYTVQISGEFPALYQNSSANAVKLLTVESWGDMVWKSMHRTFYFCTNMIYNAEDVPNLQNVSNMDSMFYNASSFNKDISDWDVSNVTIMTSMFGYATSFNQDIGNWDVGNVENMTRMFSNATSFNQDIGDWDVGKVESTSFMFLRAYSFNEDIGDWDVRNVKNMSGMFYKAYDFNQEIGNWDVSNVTDMNYMFYEATVFSQDLSSWATDNVSNCADFSDFSGLTSAQLPTAGDCF